jgi:hypothetical protein
VGGSNDVLWVHSKLIGLGRPCGLDSSDRVGKGAVLISARRLLGTLRERGTHHVKEDTISGEVGRVGPFLSVMSRLESYRVLLLFVGGDCTGHCNDDDVMLMGSRCLGYRCTCKNVGCEEAS